MITPAEVVVKRERRDREDVTHALKPKNGLIAMHVEGGTKQVVRNRASTSKERFIVLESDTSLPADLTGMSIFFTLYNSKGKEYTTLDVKGKLSREEKGIVTFSIEGGVDVGFHYYDISARGSKGFNIILATGSYVVKN